MTQKTLLALARLEIPEISDTDVISDINLLIFLNLACTEFIKMTDALPTSDTFDLVESQTEYALSTYVTNFGKIRREGLWLYNAENEKWEWMDPYTMVKLNRDFPTWLNSDDALPTRYTIEGNIINIHPNASDTYAGTDYLKLYYYARSLDMDDDDDYPFSSSKTVQYPHLADYEEILIDYVRYKALWMYGDRASAEEAKSMFVTRTLEAKQKMLYRPDLIDAMKAQGAGGINRAKSAFKV